jgi:AcrR family transcriptional regulator
MGGLAERAMSPKAANASEDRANRLRADRRLQIIEYAKQVFAERGYHNASISQIIDRAGIARGTFYLYFSNKRKVFDAILTEALGQLQRRVSIIQVSAGAPAPREQLRENLIDVLTFLHDDRPLTALLLNHGLTPDAESAERVEAFYAHVISMIDSSLRRGIEMKLVRPCQTELFAACLFGAIRGAVGYMLTGDDVPPSSIADALLVFSLGGVLKGDLPERGG